MSNREQLLQSILSNQRAFTDGLKSVVENAILPIQLKDTNFKRQFLGEPAVAVSFTLFQQIHEACYNFTSVLSRAENDKNVSEKVSSHQVLI